MFTTFGGKPSPFPLLRPPSFPVVLFSETYGFKAGTGGLVYLGLGIGFFGSAIFGAKSANTIYHHVPSSSCRHTNDANLIDSWQKKTVGRVHLKCEFLLP
jgi:hypothetical protein